MQDPKEGGGPAIARRPVSSDTIRSMGYDLAQGVLEIEFASGAVWRHRPAMAAGVSDRIWTLAEFVERTST
jgi:KTSC domain